MTERKVEPIVVGVFRTRGEAQKAIHELTEAGFGAENIGFAAREGSGEVDVESIQDKQEDAAGSAATGAATGGVVGGLLGAGAALLIPGVGPIVAAGILGAGVAAGAFAGGLYGPFISMGATEDEARYYEEQFKTGASLVTVQSGDRLDEARRILRANGAYNTEQDRAIH